MRLFGLHRAGKRMADVVVLASGKCVVAWPTSVIVYDSLDAAKAVHITHMGGRGEKTSFEDEDTDATKIMEDMVTDWMQDKCENVHVDMPVGKRGMELVGDYRAKQVRNYLKTRS